MAHNLWQLLHARRRLIRAFTGPYAYEWLHYVRVHRRWPRFLHPVTFSDKVCNRKLFDRDPRFPEVSDKSAVRRFVEARVGSDVLTQMYACVEDSQAINFAELPDSFAMKATHGSGPDFALLVPDKSQARERDLRQAAQKYLASKYGDLTNEWWYARIKPRILIEELLKDDSSGVPIDYKFFVFHGEAKLVQVESGRFIDYREAYYDRNWARQDFTYGYRQAPLTPRPKPLPEMIRVAERLGREFGFARIDLYCVNDARVVFGEITLAPEAGWRRITPPRWEYTLGDAW